MLMAVFEADLLSQFHLGFLLSPEENPWEDEATHIAVALRLKTTTYANSSR